MKREAADAARPVPAGPTWLRRALVALWLLAFVVLGVGLALRWESLMARLSRAPLPAESAGASLR